MPAPSGSVTIAWSPPSVSGTQLALSQFLIFENDLLAGTQQQVGSPTNDGSNTFTTGFSLPPGAKRTYQVQAVDTAGTKGPISDPSPEIDTPAAPPADPPGQVTGVSATLNP
jgi:hypothetical protein